MTEAKRQSQEFFNTPDRIKGIQDAQAARAKMNEDEKEEEIDNMHLSMGMLPKAIILAMKKRGKPKGPYKSIDKSDTTKETALTEQAAVPNTGDPTEIGDENGSDGRSQDQQECANNPDDELFSAESDNDNDNNDPDDNNNPDDEYSQSNYDENKKKKKKKKRSKRKTPTSTILTPRNTHWAGMRTPEEQEDADVLVAIGAKHNVARFMVMNGLVCVTEIQELSKVTITLYAKNSKRHMHWSNFMSTRFILDLERAAFKMTRITHRVSRAIIIADIDRTWCRSMNDRC